MTPGVGPGGKYPLVIGQGLLRLSLQRVDTQATLPTSAHSARPRGSEPEGAGPHHGTADSLQGLRAATVEPFVIEVFQFMDDI